MKLERKLEMKMGNGKKVFLHENDMIKKKKIIDRHSLRLLLNIRHLLDPTHFSVCSNFYLIKIFFLSHYTSGKIKIKCYNSYPKCNIFKLNPVIQYPFISFAFIFLSESTLSCPSIFIIFLQSHLRILNMQIQKCTVCSVCFPG
jgi:hypothetical protein